MNDMSMGVSVSVIREVMAERIHVSDFRGDTASYYRPKRLQPNNVRCKEKQIAKRRAKNKRKR